MMDHRGPGNPYGFVHPLHPDCTSMTAAWCPVHGDCMCECDDCVEEDTTLCSWGDHADCAMLNDDRCALHEWVPDKDWDEQRHLAWAYRREIVVTIRERIG